MTVIVLNMLWSVEWIMIGDVGVDLDEKVDWRESGAEL